MVKCNEKSLYNREYKYDNIKFILIFLVVLGHIIEDVPNLNGIYLIIYSFHMPLFIFISGYFSKGNKKSIIKSMGIYIVFQTLYFLMFKLMLHVSITLNYLQPIWISWYMFAIAIWNSLIYIIKRININKNIYAYIIILFTFFISLICGYIDQFGYFLALSRLITFFPFFLLGYFTKKNNIQILKKDGNSNKIKYLIYSIIAIICILYYINIPIINRVWFYGAYSYRNGEYDIIFKIISSLFSLCIIFIFNNFVSDKKSIISYIGKDTIYIYLLHGFIIKLYYLYINNTIRKNTTIVGIIIAIIFTITIIIRYRNNSSIYEKNSKKICKN